MCLLPSAVRTRAARSLRHRVHRSLRTAHCPDSNRATAAGAGRSCGSRGRLLGLVLRKFARGPCSSALVGGCSCCKMCCRARHVMVLAVSRLLGLCHHDARGMIEPHSLLPAEGRRQSLGAASSGGCRQQRPTSTAVGPRAATARTRLRHACGAQFRTLSLCHADAASAHPRVTPHSTQPFHGRRQPTDHTRYHDMHACNTHGAVTE